MHFNWLALVVPLFVLATVIEYIVAKRRGMQVFHLSETMANISVGIGERLLDVFVTGLFFFVYRYLHQHFGVFNIRPSILLWVALLFVTDFVWYWYHRLAHEINLFWAVHVVHHQSSDFNYTASARITVFQALLRSAFWAILPILGFPPMMISSMLIVHGLYPFFIHTQTIGKLGVLEYILVTPSHHRVHHASNDTYLDKNYGDMFIIWDKLFGTFIKEDDAQKPVYGLTKPLNSYNFLWQHFHFFIEIWIACKKQKGFRNKWKVLFGAPSGFDASAREKAEQVFGIVQHDGEEKPPLNMYVLWQIGLSLVALFFFLWYAHQIPLLQQWIITITLLITLVNCGAILEQKQWVLRLEIIRASVIVLACMIVWPGNSLIILLLVACILLRYYSSINHQYLKWVYAKI
ncbi:MAG TPA: sterol desaturase family protein [Phnomibacter sp.]|nr:sterol desaturase family protein [Phnomibacter sp.]